MKNETTSERMARLAAQTLRDKNATERELRLAGALLTQAPDKPKKTTKRK